MELTDEDLLKLWRKEPSGETKFRENLALKHGIKISANRIHKVLAQEPNFIRGVLSRKRIKRRPFSRVRVGNLFEMDLGEFHPLAGHRYILLVVDVGSQFIWTFVLGNKDSETIKKCILRIFKVMKPSEVNTDSGGEWRALSNWFKNQHIYHRIKHGLNKVCKQ